MNIESQQTITKQYKVYKAYKYQHQNLQSSNFNHIIIIILMNIESQQTKTKQYKPYRPKNTKVKIFKLQSYHHYYLGEY